MASDDKQPQDLVLEDLRGGMNNDEPPHIVPDDQYIYVQNAEFFVSTLGERRRGCEEVALTGSDLDAQDHIVHLGTYLESGALVRDTILWAVGAIFDSDTQFAYRTSLNVWTPVTPVDEPVTTSPEVLQMQSESIHGKWFVAYKSEVDRMHVWDGTILRRTGIAAPLLAPTAADSGGAGSFTGTRTYRVRFTTQNGDGDTILRSEPSPELEFEPSESNASVTVTRPATAADEAQTHWELEASDGDGNFWRIATTVIATTTAIDTINPGSEYATESEADGLSAQIGEYDIIPSVKYIKADQDRLVFAGSWEDPTHDSRIYWTPVYASPGVGNDERIRADIDSFIDLDWMEGGGLTGISTPLNGAFYAFKWTRIYKIQRTGDVNSAYESYLLSDQRGAIPGSIIDGIDEYGRGCVYFLDPSVMPMRVGSSGIQGMKNIREIAERINTDAELIVTHGCYYPDKQQVKWWVALDGEETPSLVIVLQCNNIRGTNDGARRGFSLATGAISEAWCSVTLPQVIVNEHDAAQLSFRPVIGMSPAAIWLTDIGNTDVGEPYYVKMITKPYIAAGLLNWWGVMAAALLAKSSADPDVTLTIRLVRDFGLEQDDIITNFVPGASTFVDPPPQVIKRYDDLKMSEATTVQIWFEEPEP